jgi:hypothetical protein
MSTPNSEVSTYLLIDNAMLTAGDGEAMALDEGQDWAVCVYEDRVAAVSPYLIDLYAANEAGHVDRVMSLVNAMPQKMHVSIIDTAMPLAELAQHLRRFIMVKAEGGKNLTLRFADCAVLPELAKTFTPEQWSAIAWPTARWHVHDYSGRLLALPGADAAVLRSSLPLLLTEQQLTLLNNAMVPNNVLANLRAMCHGAALPGNAAERQRWASEAVRLWRSSGNEQDIVLRWLTSAALETHGAALQQETVGALLAMRDLDQIRTGLHAVVAQHCARLNPMGERQ